MPLAHCLIVEPELAWNYMRLDIMLLVTSFYLPKASNPIFAWPFKSNTGAGGSRKEVLCSKSGGFAGVQTKDDGVKNSESSLGSNSRERLDCRRRVKEVGRVTSRFYCHFNQETQVNILNTHTHRERNRKSFLCLENGHPSIIMFILRRIETQ